MKLAPIEYENGIIWIDKSSMNNVEIGTTVWNDEDYSVYVTTVSLDSSRYHSDNVYKIVAQSSNLSIPNIPYVKVEEDVEDLASKASLEFYSDENCPNMPYETLVKQRLGYYLGWGDGYKAASAKKYSEEDLKEAFLSGMIEQYDNESFTCTGDIITKNIIVGDDTSKAIETYIQSLQPKIKNIEIEMRENSDTGNNILEWVEAVTYQKEGKTFLKVKQVNYE
jgi:hypothetical protein